MAARLLDQLSRGELVRNHTVLFSFYTRADETTRRYDAPRKGGGGEVARRVTRDIDERDVVQDIQVKG